MSENSARWARFEELRPDQLQEIVDETPVAYWPLGLIEHHGWSLPVGFDGIKADRLCGRFAERTGGVVLPVMWWGGGGGHGPFKWTFYQPMVAAQAIFETTVRKLVDFGFRCVVIVAGHYPWRRIMDDALPPIAEAHPDVLLIWGTEMELGLPEVELKGDHAARWEVSYGLALLPELVDLGAMDTPHDEFAAWTPAGPPPEGERHPLVNFDVSSPCFAQAGEDARRADAAEAEQMLAALVGHIAGRVTKHLEGT